MYATCLHCHRDLGRNERLEMFPVGRRLAFDERRGRLWVLCVPCGQWNLTPLEERWEAIEQCERLYRRAPKRVMTDEIGLASLDAGLELIRIGSPLRPEYAAWRYGGELLSRRWRDLAGGVGVALGGAGGIAASAMAATVSPVIAVAVPAGLIAATIWKIRRGQHRIVARVEHGQGVTALIRARHLLGAQLARGDGAGELRCVLPSDVGEVAVSGATAWRVAALACARRNEIGANEATVHSATARLESAGGAAAIVELAAETGSLRELRYVDRLALEMALHEQEERHALSGELAALERAWREAEEIAALADDLLYPAAARDILGRLKARAGRSG